jgi:tRNA threonylcarbamoyladenosine biosynthesis protein TsaE
MEKKLIIGINQIDHIAEELCLLKPNVHIYTFSGPLGAGKTTLIRHMLRKFGIAQPITSPTFNYVNVYENDKQELFYHFDLYRIPSLEEFIQAGFDEFLYVKNSWVFIEWPEIILPLLKKRFCNVFLDYYDDKRIIIYSTH